MSSDQAAAESVMQDHFPLHRACRDGDPAAVYELVTSGEFAVFSEDSFFGWTPAHWAARFDHIHCLEILSRQTALAKTSDVLVSGTQQTPLHVAAENGAVGAVEWLVKRRANPNKKDYSGESPLHKSARSGNVHCIVTLIESGGNCGLKNDRGETPSDLARSMGHINAANVLSERQIGGALLFGNDSAINFLPPRTNSFSSRMTRIPLVNNSRPKRNCDRDEEETIRKRICLGGGVDFVPNLSTLFGGDCESPTDMKTDETAGSDQSPDEDVSMMEEETTPEREASPGGAIPPHLIPPVDALSHGVGMPLGIAGFDAGKPARSKCVWFRSSCYI